MTTALVYALLFVAVALIAFRAGMAVRRPQPRDDDTRLLHPSRHHVIEPDSNIEQVRKVQIFDWENDR